MVIANSSYILEVQVTSASLQFKVILQVFELYLGQEGLVYILQIFKNVPTPPKNCGQRMELDLALTRGRKVVLDLRQRVESWRKALRVLKKNLPTFFQAKKLNSFYTAVRTRVLHAQKQRKTAVLQPVLSILFPGRKMAHVSKRQRKAVLEAL